jgi:putative ABC transport system permease protein
MDVIAERLARQDPATNEGWGIRAVMLQERVVGRVRPALLVFMGAAALVLLIGCANVANLLLSRSASRQREFSVRAALGAGRLRLARLLLTETLLVSLLGGLTGLLLAAWGLDVLVALAPGSIPRLDEVAMDGRVLCFALAVSLVTTILAGLMPAARVGRLNLHECLKAGERMTERARAGMRRALVASEVLLTLVLLIGAGLLLRSFKTLTCWEPGFERRNLATAWLLAPGAKYSDGNRIAALFDRVVEEAQSLPEVISAGAASAGPLFGGIEPGEFTIVGRPAPPPEEPLVARWFDIHPNYLRTIGVPLLSGRQFTGEDTRGAPMVIIINETMARRHWPDKDPLGAQITIRGETRTIVGVVADVAPLDPGKPPGCEVYWPYQQQPRWATFLVLRTGAAPATLNAVLRERIRRIEPDMRVSPLRTMEQHLGRSVSNPRFRMSLLGVFAVVSLLLAAIGIYGVISYSVSRRTREVGIRLALGAGRWNVVKTVVEEGMKPVLIGLALGIAAALGLTRLMSGMLYGVEPTDPATLVVASVLLAAVGAIACYIPARRATRVDPMVALRCE